MYIEIIRPNEATPETQQKVREIIKEALKKQQKLYYSNLKIENEPAVIDILSFMADNVPGTKRVLYSLPEYISGEYGAMYHLVHAKPIHRKVQDFLIKSLKFLAPEESKESKESK